jgi:hypothetical protein
VTPETPSTPQPSPEQQAAAAVAEARLQELLSGPAVSQANSATGIYGDTGTGKTSLVATAAEACWETYGRITRLYAADLGGYGNKMLSLIRLGIVQVWNIRNHVEPFETCEMASLGYWPEEILIPETGYADPQVRLLPPTQTRWTVICANGHVVKTVLDKRQLGGFQIACPECKALTTPQNWARVDEVTVRSKGFKHVGLYCYDSGTSMQDWIMADMAERAGRDELGGEKGAINKIVSGSLVIGSNNRAHYGFSQNRMQNWIANSRRIPGQVMPPIWTFLESRGTDDGKGGIAIFGPKISGNAKTGDVGAWVGNLLHCSKEKNDRGEDVNRLWTQTHSNPNEGNIPHLAKHRAEPGDFPPFLEDEPGTPFGKFSLRHFFENLDLKLQAATRRDAARYPNAPALVGGFDDDGEEEIITAKALSAAASVAPVRAGAPAAARPGVPAGGARPGARPGVRPSAAANAAAAAPAAPAAPVVQPEAPAAPAAAQSSTAPVAPTTPAPVPPPANTAAPVPPASAPAPQPTTPAPAPAAPVAAPPRPSPAGVTAAPVRPAARPSAARANRPPVPSGPGSTQ